MLLFAENEGMPKSKRAEEIGWALDKVLADTAASRHVGTTVSPAASKDPLMAIPAGPSNKPATIPFSAVRIHCRDITCQLTFSSAEEMEGHYLDKHCDNVDALLISSDEED